VKDHPELIDAAGDQKNIPAFWNHMNSIDYNPALDQIMLSVRGNSEVWIIDHSTTTAEAKGHTGGKYGKGGDLLYRYGNPMAYRMGTSADQKFYQQHDAEWVRPDCPGAGNITVFNNGLGRNYSTIDEITPPIDANGNYLRTAGAAFGPSSFYWSYQATPPTALYAEAISGAQRLRNGNTIICDGTHGTFTEVTQTGEVVWKYVCPAVKTGPLYFSEAIPDDPARVGEKMNAVFRVYKYLPDYAAFDGKDLTPGYFVEKYPTSVEDDFTQQLLSFKLLQNYPNPFNPETNIGYQLPASGHVSLKVYDVSGNEVANLVDEFKEAGYHNIPFSIFNWRLTSGMYFYTIRVNGWHQTKKMLLIK
ncbi:MAG: aryl-sulfate sulfotransferase, partial [bacterium]|nr:aryl-sulfate sulfotransferase [bacterium]